MRDKVAVVILNWNGAGMLRRFLPGVARHSQAQAAVYVADNGSTDDSLALLRTDFPEVRVIELKQNYGFAEGYNRALRRIEADYFLLLNSDVEVGEGWLDPLLRYMDEHATVAACQPKLLSWSEPDRFEYAGAAGGFLDCYGYPFCRGRIQATVEADKGQYDTPQSLFWATGAALLIRSDVYWEAGGLDDRFFAHMEEIDLCWRLRSRGYGVVCVPESSVKHVGGGTLSKENPRKTFLNFRNNLLMLYKNLPDDDLRRVMRVRRMLDALASVMFLLKGQWGNFRAVWQARAAYRRMRPDFEADRLRNREARRLASIPEQSSFSILARYYLHGIRCFSQLKDF